MFLWVFGGISVPVPVLVIIVPTACHVIYFHGFWGTMTDVQMNFKGKDGNSGVLKLGEISNEAIMISNLPLLFADGYPTCLEKFTLRQIQKFVPFMLQCSMGESYLDKYTPAPKWWPEDLPFSIRVEKPSQMDDSRWFATLKSMVCRCYTYHGCEFMLRFCTELSDCPIQMYRFVESWDGTTSLYNRESGRLMVTFRNENREYDKEVETSPRRLLLPRNSTQNPSRLMVQPPTFDIYLCDNCDGEFDSLTEVQEHERTCGRQDQDADPDPDLPELPPEVPPEEPNKEAFLEYLCLKDIEKGSSPELKSPVREPRHRRRYPRGMTFARCCSVPFSSPLGLIIQQICRVSSVKPQMLINRMERHCVTKLRGLRPRVSDKREKEVKGSDVTEWPITYKPPHPKKSQDIWNHYYCFSEKERRERLATRLAGGLNWRSRRLLSMCREVRVLVKRLTEEEIFYLPMRVQTPEPATTFQFPTLLPNTMYTYRTKPGCPQEIEVLQSSSFDCSPDPTIPVIDLVSTDDENEGLDDVQPTSPVSVSEMNFEQSLHGIEEDEQVYCDKDSNHDLTVYPFIETSTYNTFTQVETPSMEYETSSQSWQMNICIKSPSEAPTHSTYAEQQQNLHMSPESLQVFEHEVDSIVNTQVLECSAPTDEKVYELENFARNRKMQSKTQFVTPPFEVTSTQLPGLPKLTYCKQKKNLTENVPDHSPSSRDVCDIVEITESSNILCQRKRGKIKSCDTLPTSRNPFCSKSASPSATVYSQKDDVTIKNDPVDVSVTKNTYLQKFQSKLLNTTLPKLTPAPSLRTDGNGNVFPSLRYGPVDPLETSSSKFTLPSSTVSSMQLSAQKLDFAQSGKGTFNCDSWRDSDSMHRGEAKQLTRKETPEASKNTPVAMEIILDDGDDDVESSGCKKRNLQLYDSAVTAVDSATQVDGEDVIGAEDSDAQTTIWEEGSLSYYCATTQEKSSPGILLNCNLERLKNPTGCVL